MNLLNQHFGRLATSFAPRMCALLLMAGCAAPGGPALMAQDVDFVRDVQPIFERHCLSCHGPEKEETFRIDDRRATLDGYVEKGDAESSQLYEVLVSDDPEILMPPPEEENPLSAEQIAIIRAWIDGGAAWPADVKFTVPPERKDEPVAGAGKQDSADESVVPPVVKRPARSLGERWWLALGALHPAVVHLPIGLLLGAGLFALLGLRGNFVMGDCAYYCLWLGTLGCIAASVLGWPYAITENRGGDVADLFNTEKAIFLHRISGIGVSLFALILALYASAKRASDPDDGLLWKLGAILLAAAIGFVGHSGGELTHGKNLYRPLFEVIEESTGWDPAGIRQPGPAPADHAPGAAAPDASSQPATD